MSRKLLLIVAAMVVLVAGCTSTSRMNREIATRESSIAEMEEEVQRKNDEINRQRAELSLRDEKIALKNEEIARLQGDIDKLGNQVNKEEERVDMLNDDLQRVLGDLQNKEKLWLQEKQGMSTITMPNAATFASGSTQLTAQGKAIIDTIWTVLSKYPDRDVFIEGHTDSIPIGPALQRRFDSNWELSAARSVAVLRYVLSNYEAEAGRLGAVGYGEHRPVASNSTEGGRTLNRRVVISVRPRK